MTAPPTPLPAGPIPWRGLIQGVQPRIDLMRSFDQRSHTYLGYLVIVDGTMGDTARQFMLRIGPGMQQKHALRAGDVLSGKARAVCDPERETAHLYRVSGLMLESRGPDAASGGPPFLGTPPALPVYRERGHRRLDARTYDARCRTCRWGCRMAVTMIIDQWRPERREQRFETFCYGPKSCRQYRSGPARKVPGRNGMSWQEEDWVDEEAVEHRAADE